MNKCYILRVYEEDGYLIFKNGEDQKEYELPLYYFGDRPLGYGMRFSLNTINGRICGVNTYPYYENKTTEESILADFYISCLDPQEPIKVKTYNNLCYDQHVYFWSGIYSQWYKCDMVIDHITFNCCEQYMMYNKAVVFGDVVTAVKILKTTDPRKQKELGRQVAKFDHNVWQWVAPVFVFRANMAKFSQHADLKQQILQTKGKLLVEASPNDAIWGIGIDEETAKTTAVRDWPGTNLLGLALTEVRDTLSGDLV